MSGFILVFLLSSCVNPTSKYGETTENEEVNQKDLLKHDLKGKVQSYKEMSYKAVELWYGKITKDTKENSEFSNNDYQRKYDKIGNLIEENCYLSDGGLYNKQIFKYDETGNLIEENHYESSGRRYSQMNYKYDDKGNLIEGRQHRSDNTLYDKQTYKYNKKGNLIGIDRYNSSAILYEKQINKYDAKGNLVEEISYDSDGCMQSQVSYVYSEKGSKIEEKFFFTRCNVFDEYTLQNTYDDKGHITNRSRYETDGSLYRKDSYVYNKLGNIIEEFQCFSDSDLIDNKTYLYEYDNKGNWTQRIQFDDKIPMYVVEREYEYFK